MDDVEHHLALVDLDGVILQPAAVLVAASTGAVEVATAKVERTSAAVDKARDGVEQVNTERAEVGLEPVSTSPEAAAAATGPSSAPAPVSGGTSDAATDRASQAVSYVEDVVPGRSTGLLLALVGGILALLVLIAREWTR